MARGAFCPACGAKVNEDGLFCGECGQRLDMEIPEYEEVQLPAAVPVSDPVIYDLDGVRGRHIKIYEDKCVLTVSVTLGSILTGNLADGEKTIYYSDCIGVQYKRCGGLIIGYLQLETAGAIMNNRGDNFFNENTFTFDGSTVSNEVMDQVAAYVKKRVEECKHSKNAPVAAALSPADEIRKYKELMDMGIISPAEFELKKKQLLGL